MLGLLRTGELEQGQDEPVEKVMRPGPSTFRPHVLIEAGPSHDPARPADVAGDHLQRPSGRAAEGRTRPGWRLSRPGPSVITGGPMTSTEAARQPQPAHGAAWWWSAVRSANECSASKPSAPDACASSSGSHRLFSMPTEDEPSGSDLFSALRALCRQPPADDPQSCYFLISSASISRRTDLDSRNPPVSRAAFHFRPQSSRLTSRTTPEADPLVAPGVDRAAEELDVNGDGAGDPSDGEVAVDHLLSPSPRRTAVLRT